MEVDDRSGVASGKGSRTNDVVFETVSTLYLVEGVIKRRADSGGDVAAERVINGYNSFGGSSGSSSSAGGGSVSTGGGLAGGNVGGQERLKWKLVTNQLGIDVKDVSADVLFEELKSTESEALIRKLEGKRTELFDLLTTQVGCEMPRWHGELESHWCLRVFDPWMKKLMENGGTPTKRTLRFQAVLMCDFVYHMNTVCNGFSSSERRTFVLDVLENYKEYEEKCDKEFVGGHLELQFVEGEV